MIIMMILSFQTQSASFQGDIDVKQKSLADFFMTDSISRASPTMAKCVQAVKKVQARA
jgi:hypothetical protein